MDEEVKVKLTRQEVEAQILRAKGEIDQAVRRIEQYNGIVQYCEHLLNDYDLGANDVSTKTEGQNS